MQEAAPQRSSSTDPRLELQQHGEIDRRIYSDPDVYERELEQLFGRTWLFLGHESMFRESGDFVTTTMGEDPVIVCRRADGSIGAYLNSCRHRGNRVCLFDAGNTTSFTCSYHGWRYGLDGELRHVPFLKAAYDGRLDVESLGLVPVPRIADYGGLIFGCWDEDVESLDDHLGDMRFYLDHLLLASWGGGIEVLFPNRHGYELRANWKVMAGNAVGDHYHTMATHSSVFKLGLSQPSGYDQDQDPDGPFEIAVGDGHGIGGVYLGDRALQRDLDRAEKAGLGAEGEAYLRERFRRKMAALHDIEAKPYRFSHSTVFPNLSITGAGGALDAPGIYQWQPRGPRRTDVYQWYVIERDAPEAIRQMALHSPGDDGQLASGFFAQDDAENFERVTESARTTRAREVPFHIGMGIDFEGEWADQESWNTRGLPGLVGPRFTEHSERRFYARWARHLGYEVR